MNTTVLQLFVDDGIVPSFIILALIVCIALVRNKLFKVPVHSEL
jgi:hypothetical protein